MITLHVIFLWHYDVRVCVKLVFQAFLTAWSSLSVVFVQVPAPPASSTVWIIFFFTHVVQLHSAVSPLLSPAPQALWLIKDGTQTWPTGVRKVGSLESHRAQRRAACRQDSWGKTARGAPHYFAPGWSSEVIHIFYKGISRCVRVYQSHNEAQSSQQGWTCNSVLSPTLCLAAVAPTLGVSFSM